MDFSPDPLALEAKKLSPDEITHADQVIPKPLAPQPGKIGRPTNEEVARRETEAANAARLAADIQRASELWDDLQAEIVMIPVDEATGHLGGQFGLEEKETRYLKEAIPLYTRHRLGWQPEGDKVIDYLFWGTITLVMGRRLASFAVMWYMKRYGKLPEGMTLDNAPDIRPEGDGQINPMPDTPGPP